MAEALRVTVAYAAPGKKLMRETGVAPGTTIAEAIAQSGIAQDLAGLDVAGLKVGVWGRVKPRETPVADGDRIELYRPLTADPKAARAQRARKAKAAKA